MPAPHFAAHIRDVGIGRSSPRRPPARGPESSGGSKEAPAFRERGKVRLLLNDPAKALEDLDRAAALAPSDAESFRARADARSRLEQWSQAIDDYTRALALNFELAAIYNGRAHAWAQLNQPGKAIDDYTRGIRMRLDNPEPYKQRGMIPADA